MTQQPRQFSAREKVAILRRHFLEKVPVSDLCDQNHLNPTLFYRWQKEFFENGAAAFAHDNGSEVRRLVTDFVAHYNGKRLHSAIGYVAPLDKLEGRAEAIWAERDRKLAVAREARAARRAQAKLGTEPKELLTTRKETPIIHPAGETDAGSPEPVEGWIATRQARLPKPRRRQG